MLTSPTNTTHMGMGLNHQYLDAVSVSVYHGPSRLAHILSSWCAMAAHGGR